MLTRTTSLLTSIASGAASTVGWFFFAMLVAYFILAESGGIPGRMISLRFPGYTEDMSKFGRYLNGIWNAFLRGQLTIIFITVVVYIILLSILLVMLESVNSIRLGNPQLFKALEWVITIIFTIEYLLRIWATPKPFRYIFSCIYI
jgi:hypothetical protein